ncbi:MAG: diguanylate cyclase [Spirochaetales bacterium]|nr:diguanylate cyclase [Spirochaetales bacterium]
MALKSEGSREISPSFYWLGSGRSDDFLQINSYTVVRNGLSLLLDPGPVLLFEEIRDAFRAVTTDPVPSIIFLSHQDPDVCSSLSRWEEEGFCGTVIAHWKTAWILQDISTRCTVFGAGRDKALSPEISLMGLEILNLPFVHSPGAIALWDGETKTLFSGDLLSSFSQSEELYFETSDMEGLLGFHRAYMPSLYWLKNGLNEIAEKKPGLICPHYGTLISGKSEEVLAALSMLDLDDPRRIASEDKEDILGEIRKLKMSNFELKKSMVLSLDDKILDAVTGLYNQTYLDSFFPLFYNGNKEGYYLTIRLDDMKDFNSLYGFREGDAAISVLAQLLISIKEDGFLLFRGAGPIITMLVPGKTKDEVMDIMEHIQKEVSQSEAFLKEMTCSIAAVFLGDLAESSDPPETALKKALLIRLKYLDKLGPDSICLSPEKDQLPSGNPLIMIFDPDRINGRFLKDFLERRDYDVIVKTDGTRALHSIDMNRPSLIISEIHISPLDAFRFRSRLLESADLKDIPFILMSHIKSDPFVTRAFQLKIYHFLKKPVSLAELEGLVGYLIKDQDEY